MPHRDDWIERIGKAPPELRPALVAAAALLDPPFAREALGFPALEAEVHDLTLPALMAPALPYPRAALHDNAEILLGKRPDEVVVGLTRREAHEYLMHEHGCSGAGPFLFHKRFGRRLPELSVAVARWLVECDKDPSQREALHRERIVRVAGQELRGSVLSHAEEIAIIDLCGSVVGTLRNAMRRRERENAAAAKAKAWDPNNLAPAPDWFEFPALRSSERVERLNSVAQLGVEAALMDHCVDRYASRVASGSCLILSLRVDDDRSTAEVLTGPIVETQHKGKSNSEPPIDCVLLLDRCLEHWRKLHRELEPDE